MPNAKKKKRPKKSQFTFGEARELTRLLALLQRVERRNKVPVKARLSVEYRSHYRLLRDAKAKNFDAGDVIYAIEAQIEHLRRSIEYQEPKRDDSPAGVVRRKVQGVQLPYVWVVYAWSGKFERWFLLAFLRTRTLRAPNRKRLTKLREKWNVPKSVVVRFRELFTAAAFPDLGVDDPEIAYGLRRHRDRKRYAPDPKAIRANIPKPNVFPTRKLKGV